MIGALLLRDGYACAYCGARLEGTDFEVDHVKALSVGGATRPANLVCACDGCNRRKGNGPVPVKARAEVRRRTARVVDLRAGRAVGDALYPWAPVRREREAQRKARVRAAGKDVTFP